VREGGPSRFPSSLSRWKQVGTHLKFLGTHSEKLPGTHFDLIVPRNWDCEPEVDVAPPRRGFPNSCCVVEHHENRQESRQRCSPLFGVNVEISVPRNSTARSFDAIELRVGKIVCSDVTHVVTKVQIDRSRISAVPDFTKSSPVFMNTTSRVMMTLLPSQMR
jgi:hypothetical protein